MSRRGEYDAIVVGAGPVGAATALALVRDGFHVALVEPHPPKPKDPVADVDLRVVAVAPDARDLLDALDAWAPISQVRASPYRCMRVWDANAPGELAFDAAERGESALGFIVENRLIQQTLWERLVGIGDASTQGNGADHRDVPVEHTRTLKLRLCAPGAVADIEHDADAVVALLADGTRLRAKVLIAADGAESPVRKRLGIEFRGRDYGQRAIVAHVTTERPHQETAWQRFLPGGPLAFLPLADGRCSIVWTLPEDEATRVLALADEEFCAEVGRAFDLRLGAITATSPRAAFPLRLRLAARYLSGRCVLIGDAAHIVHPLAGQGMNLGFRDATCLRRVLSGARSRGSDIGSTHVLRRYERERRSENALAARGLDAIERTFGSSSAALALLRGAGLGLVDRIGPVKQFFAAIAAGR